MLLAMNSLNNPAGRLHRLLVKLVAVNDGVPIAQAWAQVLELDAELVRQELGGVAQLVYEINGAVSDPALQPLEASVRRFRGVWLEAAFPLQHNFQEGVHLIKPGPEALEALHVVALHLSTVAPDGSVLSDETRDNKLDQIHALITEVRADGDLPEEIVHRIVDRLQQVERALLHIDIGGPEALRLAAEALMGAVADASVKSPVARAADVLTRTFSLAAIILTLATAPAQLPASVEAYEGWVGALTVAPAHVEKHQQALPAPDGQEVIDATVVEEADENTDPDSAPP